MAQITKLVSEKIEDAVRNGEKAGYLYVSFLHNFLKRCLHHVYENLAVGSFGQDNHF